MILLRDFSDRLKPPSTLLRWAFPTKATTIVTATEISDCPRKGVLGSRMQISTRLGPVIPHGHRSQAGGFMTKMAPVSVAMNMGNNGYKRFFFPPIEDSFKHMRNCEGLTHFFHVCSF